VDKNGNQDLSDLEKTIAKTIREGNLNLISHLAVENADVAATVAKLSTPKQIEDLANRSEQHKESLKKGLETASTQNPDDEKIQFAYASRHGDPRRLTEKQKVEWAQKVGVGGMKELAFFDATVANSIPPNKLIKLIEEMKGPMANEYIKHIKQNKSAAGHELAMSHAYLSKLGGETTKRAPFTTV
jgi:hypothetical protein